MSAVIDVEFTRKLREKPDDSHEAIVTASKGLDALLADLPDGVEVQYTYRLIDGLAIRASGQMLSQMATLASVKAIEPVKAVEGC